MAYFNLNFVTDPPNDELVDEVTQLNNNWEEIGNKLEPFNHQPAQFGAIVPPIGTEAFDPEHPSDATRITAWNGTTWIRAVSHTVTWDAPVIIPIRSPRVIRASFPVYAKINRYSRHVVLSGGVLFDNTAAAWPTNTTYEITTDTALSSDYGPPEPEIQQGSAGNITTANGFASAVVRIEKISTRTAISVRYQGNSGGGNYIQLDGIQWWY